MKSNQPSYFDKVTRKMICKEFLESFINNDNDSLAAPLSYLRSAFTQLEEAPLEELSYSQKANKNLYDYKNNGKERQIYNEILEDCGSIELTFSKSQEGTVHKYWKVKLGRERGKGKIQKSDYTS